MSLSRFEDISENTTKYSYTFLYPPYPLPLLTRMEDMHELIQRTISSSLNILPSDRVVFHVQVESILNDSPISKLRVFSSLSQISVDFLLNMFTNILQSAETLSLEGTRLIIAPVGIGMQTPYSTGRSIQSGGIPDHFKNRGLLNHPITKKSKAAAELLVQLGNCGIFAFLLGFYGTSTPFDVIVNKVKSIAIELSLPESGININLHFNSLIQLPEFSNYRVVILSENTQVEYVAVGPDWTIYQNDKLAKDPFSIYICYSHRDKHYFFINNLPIFKLKATGKMTCYFCTFTSSSKNSLNKHSCASIMSESFKFCSICTKGFPTPETFNEHISSALNLPSPCENCTKSLFHGLDCYNFHLKNNCKAPVNIEHFTCATCERNYNSLKPHVCTPTVHCGTCREEFPVLERKTHRCFLQRETKFYQAFKTFKNSISMKLHWFYDFETCRSKLLKVDQWQHKVVAWAMRLIILPGQEEIINASNILTHLSTFGDYSFIDNTIRFTGFSIDSFVTLTEKLSFKLSSYTFTSTLWAHNGSKFDAKFILDYYLHNRNAEIHGSSFDFEPYFNLYPKSFFCWKENKKQSSKRSIKLSQVNGKLLSVTIDNISFKCSLAHFTQPLRNLPKMFGFKNQVKKGEFPYTLISENWDYINVNGLPDLEYYDVDAQSSSRRKELIDWWFEEQNFRNAYIPPSLLSLHSKTSTFNPILPTVPWIYKQELLSYLYADIDVGAEALLQYHITAHELQQSIPAYTGDFVSPLDHTTAPKWASVIYKTWFLPDNICILKEAEAKYIRDSLHGGRTDKRANIVSITPERLLEGDTMGYYDFTSLYPSVQKTSVHNTHFPVGKPTWVGSNTEWRSSITSNSTLIAAMGDKTGFLTITAKRTKYTTHPTLSTYENNKLLFKNDDIIHQTYAWPEIQEAIRCEEISIETVHDGLLFEKGQVFNDYVDFFFKIKNMAEKSGNKGLRSLAKLLLNSLWGKLGQRSYPVAEWVTDKTRHFHIMDAVDKGYIEILACIPKTDYKVWYEYRIVNDYKNIGSTAYQLASYVSMWGRVMLHQKILSVHGQRALYCDTDSGIIYLRKNDPMPFIGDGLGLLTNELPGILESNGIPSSQYKKCWISSGVFVAPKTYALLIETDKGHKITKCVCKGFELNFQNTAKINYYTMHDLIAGKKNLARLSSTLDSPPTYLITEPSLHFGSQFKKNENTPVESYRRKALSGNYDKGIDHPTDNRLVIPFGPFKPNYSFLNFENENQHYE